MVMILKDTEERNNFEVEIATLKFSDPERRSGRPNQFSDAHQLFLGNVPHHATETDLRQLFERYGKVAELRVHSKPNNNNVRVPNYGFITFEESQVVVKVLNDLVSSLFLLFNYLFFTDFSSPTHRFFVH